jgi:drug/metabolite transporter (DMT)-like permease
MFYALAAFFLWVLVDTIRKISMVGHVILSPFIFMAIVGVTGAVLIGSATAFKKKTSLLRPRSLPEQAGIAFCCAGINYTNTIALKYLSLTMFYAIVFSAPLVIAALSALLKHEKLSPLKICCLVAGFFGVVLAIGVPQGGGEVTGYLAIFASVFFFSLSAILTHKLAKRDTVESIQFWSFLCVGFAGICGSLVQGALLPGPALALLVFLGACIDVGGNLLYTTALHNTASTNVAQLHYTQIISGAILGYLIWHEIPTWNLILGSLIIIGAGFVIALQVHRQDGVLRAGRKN